jgi:hypothetical protein
MYNCFFLYRRFFGFNIKKTPLFEIQFIFHVVSIISVDLLYPTVDIIFYVLGNLIVEYLRGIQRDARTRVSNDVESIKFIVDKHNRVIELTRKLFTIYSPIIAIKFVLMGLWICVLGFEVLTVFIILMIKLMISLMIFNQILIPFRLARRLCRLFSSCSLSASR